MEDLAAYFKNIRGRGVLATADADGVPNAAVYATPHAMEDGQVAFIMPHRKTHANLEKNPKAAYLFMEEGSGYQGRRLYLTMTGEEKNTGLLLSIRRHASDPEKMSTDPRFLVFFTVDAVLPLVGPGEEEES
ncbi:MAG: pyridoxamine 5'-phosphate oxidase family protein [Pseudomonadota bacterium]